MLDCVGPNITCSWRNWMKTSPGLSEFSWTLRSQMEDRRGWYCLPTPLWVSPSCCFLCLLSCSRRTGQGIYSTHFIELWEWSNQNGNNFVLLFNFVGFSLLERFTMKRFFLHGLSLHSVSSLSAFLFWFNYYPLEAFHVMFKKMYSPLHSHKKSRSR